MRGILVTHEHTTTSRARAYSRAGTAFPFLHRPDMAAANGKLDGVAPRAVRVIDKSEFYIDDLLIEPFEIPHDAADPVGYCISCGNRRAAVATDLGWFPQKIEYLAARMRPCTARIQPRYRHAQHRPLPPRAERPHPLAHGHLSTTRRATPRSARVGGRHVHTAGHLSRENNLEQLAYRTVTDALLAQGIQPAAT